ncbi:MAG TPA: S8 family serine peptidase, partial [Blastocatellia bacterium]|nr:S8 family serine peptidase [Blastocatellia bacterium]
MKTSKSVLKVLMVALLVAAFLMAGIPFTESPEGVALAQTFSTAPKLSLDLHEAISSAPNKPVRVIVDMEPSLQGKAYSKVLSKLSEKGGIITRNLNGGQMAAVMIPGGAISSLADDKSIRYISLDRDTQVAGHLETASGAALARNLGTTATGTIDGRNIGIAILDSGIYAAHHSFLTNRIVASVDFTGEARTDDPYGHGTHVASIAAGNGHICGGAYTGVAPAAKIINVRVLNSLGSGSLSNAIAGIDWCIANKAAYNIRVINISFGATAVSSYVNDPLCQAARRAFNAGIVVCAASGNSGKNASGNKIYGAIHSPGIEPSVITVGAANTYGTNSRADDTLCSYSSRGPSRGYTTTAGVKRYDNLIKPELVAPGNKIIGAQSPNNRILSITPSLDANVSISAVHKMMTMSGTSMA